MVSIRSSYSVPKRLLQISEPEGSSLRRKTSDSPALVRGPAPKSTVPSKEPET
ncbi:hypothetical protein [Sorangium sp. So ce1335]|uniref:hypothetical protein n=1 Tax=Sorangium sp. So ce1335 TaxID=3133335 RepID=UPI003F63771D